MSFDAAKNVPEIDLSNLKTQTSNALMSSVEFTPREGNKAGQTDRGFIAGMTDSISDMFSSDAGKIGAGIAIGAAAVLSRGKISRYLNEADGALTASSKTYGAFRHTMGEAAGNLGERLDTLGKYGRVHTRFAGRQFGEAAESLSAGLGKLKPDISGFDYSSISKFGEGAVRSASKHGIQARILGRDLYRAAADKANQWGAGVKGWKFNWSRSGSNPHVESKPRLLEPPTIDATAN